MVIARTEAGWISYMEYLLAELGTARRRKAELERGPAPPESQLRQRLERPEGRPEPEPRSSVDDAVVPISSVRTWARARGMDVGIRGHLSQEIIDLFKREPSWGSRREPESVPAFSRSRRRRLGVCRP